MFILSTLSSSSAIPTVLTSPRVSFASLSSTSSSSCSAKVLAASVRLGEARRFACPCFFAMAELVKDKEVATVAESGGAGGASALASSSGAERKEAKRSRAFLYASSEEELLSGIRKEKEAGRLPATVASGMEELYHNYKNAIFQSGNRKADEIVLSNMAAALDRICFEVEEPFAFSPYHKALREPFDYHMFGQNYIRPLIDFSFLFNKREEEMD